MKKFLSLILIISILLCSIVYGEDTEEEPKAGDFAGNVYSTDIVVDIDGMKINSYNIEGETFVLVDDLKDYGFDVEFDKEQSSVSLEVKKLPEIKPDIVPKTYSKIGKIIGKAYYTDTYISINAYGERVYSINNKMVISVDGLGDIYARATIESNANREIGYSHMGFQCVWNENKRTLSLNCLRPGSVIKSNMGYVIMDSFKFGGYQVSSCKFFSDISKQVESILYDYDSNTKYCDLDALLSAFDVKYTFENNVLNITEEINSDIEEEIDRTTGIVHGGTSLPYTNITVKKNGNVISIDDNVNSLIYEGRISIDIELFEKIIGRPLFLGPRNQ